MDPTVYIIGAAIVTVVLAVISFIFKDRVAAAAEDGNAQAGPERARRAVPINRAELPAGGARNRRTAGGRLQRARDAAEEERRMDEEDGSDDELWDHIAQPAGKIGTKKRAKLEEKVRRRAEREAMEQEREEQKEREVMKEEDRKKEEERREMRRIQKEEEERKKKEEKEKREYEEYLAMKADFVIEEEGQDASNDADEAELLRDFIDHIKTNKVVILEDVASHFKLKTQAVIERIETLMKDETLTGVLDDRGKFIFITQEELNSVAKFIRQRGRVSIQELAESSNQLIRTKPLQEQEAAEAAA